MGIEHVKISSCTSGGVGGGALFVDEGSTVHLIGESQLEDNQARGTDARGGHIRVAASTLILHPAVSSSPTTKLQGFYWPAAPPLFPEKELLVYRREKSSILARGTSTSGAGSIFCAASSSASRFQIFENGDGAESAATCQTQMYEMKCIICR